MRFIARMESIDTTFRKKRCFDIPNCQNPENLTDFRGFSQFRVRVLRVHTRTGTCPHIVERRVVRTLRLCEWQCHGHSGNEGRTGSRNPVLEFHTLLSLVQNHVKLEIHL